MRGQEAVKRAITIAAAGSHNLLMVGPPGTGKTMLAQRMPGILPPLNRGPNRWRRRGFIRRWDCCPTASR